MRIVGLGFFDVFETRAKPLVSCQPLARGWPLLKSNMSSLTQETRPQSWHFVDQSRKLFPRLLESPTACQPFQAAPRT